MNTFRLTLLETISPGRLPHLEFLWGINVHMSMCLYSWSFHPVGLAVCGGGPSRGPGFCRQGGHGRTFPWSTVTNHSVKMLEQRNSTRLQLGPSFRVVWMLRAGNWSGNSHKMLIIMFAAILVLSPQCFHLKGDILWQGCGFSLPLYLGWSVCL